MKYALNLAEDNRVLSATFAKFAPVGAVLVNTIPEGNIANYKYENGAYFYDPLPEPEPVEPEATIEDRVSELEEALEMILSGVTE